MHIHQGPGPSSAVTCETRRQEGQGRQARSASPLSKSPRLTAASPPKEPGQGDDKGQLHTPFLQPAQPWAPSHTLQQMCSLGHLYDGFVSFKVNHVILFICSSVPLTTGKRWREVQKINKLIKYSLISQDLIFPWPLAHKC